MGHRPFPDPDRALRHIRRRPLAGEPPLTDHELPDVRLAAAAVTGEPTPGPALPTPPGEARHA